MNRVKQAFVAPSIKFFKEKFLSNNNLINYYDDTNSGYNRAYQYRVNTGVPRFMVH